MDGGKHKLFLKYVETISSPIVSTESLMKMTVMDVMAKRDVAIFDVPGDFLYGEITEGEIHSEAEGIIFRHHVYC